MNTRAHLPSSASVVAQRQSRLAYVRLGNRKPAAGAVASQMKVAPNPLSVNQ